MTPLLPSRCGPGARTMVCCLRLRLRCGRARVIEGQDGEQAYKFAHVLCMPSPNPPKTSAR